MKLAILGSTGSIGTQTLEVLSQLDDDVTVTALAAGRNVPLLAKQILRLRPRCVGVAGPEQADQLAKLIDPARIDIHHGPQGLITCATAAGPTRVLNALVGAVGLPPTLAALEAGSDVALANKESLVIGGALVQQALERGSHPRGEKPQLLPVDSEHSALWQLLQGQALEDVARLWLTASGGALRDWPLDRLADAAPDDVMRHPNWDMGARITVDSATLVNKAFEVVEAHWLFGVPSDCIRAVLHPQSVVHGMVELNDGALLAHLGMPDMRVPIQYALCAPRHRPLDVPRVDWAGLRLDFDEVDFTRYPAFETVLAAGREGGTALAALNAADEVLVSRFLRREIPFTSIAKGLAAVLDGHPKQSVSLDNVLEADRRARETAARL